MEICAVDKRCQWHPEEINVKGKKLGTVTDTLDGGSKPEVISRIAKAKANLES